MTNYENAMAGKWFVRNDPVLKVRRDLVQSLCYKYNHTDPKDEKTKRELIEQIIPNAPEDCRFNPPFYCDYGDRIKLGKNFFANYDCKILDGGLVTFGDDVLIGTNVTFITINHAISPEDRKNGYQIYKPITVGNNVWIGSNVTIVPGITIGDNAVIAAGSVVVKDVQANTLVGGNPAREIKNI